MMSEQEPSDPSRSYRVVAQIIKPDHQLEIVMYCRAISEEQACIQLDNAICKHFGIGLGVMVMRAEQQPEGAAEPGD